MLKKIKSFFKMCINTWEEYSRMEYNRYASGYYIHSLPEPKTKCPTSRHGRLRSFTIGGQKYKPYSYPKTSPHIIDAIPIYGTSFHVSTEMANKLRTSPEFSKNMKLFINGNLGTPWLDSETYKRACVIDKIMNDLNGQNCPKCKIGFVKVKDNRVIPIFNVLYDGISEGIYNAE